ncbi:MAG: hypothetical protein NVS3B3_05900 [Aquirhabdus sp.]
MAFDASQDQLAQNQQNAGANGASQLSGGGGFAGQGGTGASGQSGASQADPTSSGSWTNLNSYLSANSDQAGTMGHAIAGNVGAQAGQAQSDLSSISQGFQNQQPYQAINNTTGSMVDQAFSDPSQYSGATPQSTSKAESYLNNSYGATPATNDITQYQGPNGQSWAGLQNEYNTANNNLQNTQSESGRGVLLKDQYGKNGQQYNQGEQSFDQLLLQQDPSNQNTFNTLYHQYAPGIVTGQGGASGQSADLSNAYTTAQNYAQKEHGLGAQYQTQAQNDLSNQISGLSTTVGNEKNTASTNFQSAYDQIANALKSGTITQAQADQLGLKVTANAAPTNNATYAGVRGPQMQGSVGTIQSYGASPGSYLSENTNPYAGSNGANAAATAQDFNNFQGLQSLLSGYQGGNAADYNKALSGVGLTGTHDDAAKIPIPQSSYSFNNARFNQDVTTNQNQFNTINSDLLSGFAAANPQSSGSNSTLGISSNTSNPVSPADQAYALQQQTQYWGAKLASDPASVPDSIKALLQKYAQAQTNYGPIGDIGVSG